MEGLKIRKVTSVDLAALQNISIRTFSETFSEVNSEENMRRYFETRFSMERLSKELSNKNSEFYFAVIDSRVAGYLKVNSGNAQTEMQGDNALEIERIYVLKEFQGKKIGQSLYEKALNIATNRNAGFIWLGVWENNHRALSFYRKNRFEVFDSHIFVLGDSRQTDYLMKLCLGTPRNV